MVPLLRRLARNGFRRGVLGRSRAWLVVGITATAVRLVTRLLARKPEVVYSTRLQPGEALRITALPPE